MSDSHILVVDDEPEIRQLFVDILAPQGYQVTAVGSGAVAIARAREQEFQIVFLDIKMPGMNGAEAFVALRQLLPQAQYVMITGYAGSELVDESLAGGALLCLNKPFGVADVLDLVRSLEHSAAAAGAS
jgi:CheY-like chemotaxis protein